MNIIRVIFLGHHVTRSRISVFNADLPTIRRALYLHTIPHTNLHLIQCQRMFLHHITTGSCAEHAVDVSTSPHPDRSVHRALCQDFETAADMYKAVLNMILDAMDKQLSTENLVHISFALNISVSGTWNVRFKLRSAIRKHTQTIVQHWF
jgi:uncharacterized protein (DUF2267 family)